MLEFIILMTNMWTYVRVVNDTLITGYRQTRGWARNRTVYFAMTFRNHSKIMDRKMKTDKLITKVFGVNGTKRRIFH